MISIRDLDVHLGRFALERVSFDVPQGGYGVVIGPAGSGKTTLLEAIAGIIPSRGGRVILGGEDLTHAAPEARRLSLVYQHAFLFPHLDVRSNVMYGAAREAAHDAIARFGLESFVNRDVRSLSGGERQLVAIARAVARRPEVLLLDEPFSALDPRTRAAARRVLRTLYFERRFTVLHVTHDFSEAGLLGDVAVLLDRGRVLQRGEPEQLFRKPASPYIADFLGAENVFAGEVRPIHATAPDFIEGAPDEFARNAVAFTTGALTFYALGDAVPGPAHAVIRAEEIMLSLETSTSSVRNQFAGRVVDVAPAGAVTRVTIDARGTPLVSAITTRSVRELGIAPGVDVVAAFKATAVHIC